MDRPKPSYMMTATVNPATNISYYYGGTPIDYVGSSFVSLLVDLVPEKKQIVINHIVDSPPSSQALIQTLVFGKSYRQSIPTLFVPVEYHTALI